MDPPGSFSIAPTAGQTTRASLGETFDLDNIQTPPNRSGLDLAGHGPQTTEVGSTDVVSRVENPELLRSKEKNRHSNKRRPDEENSDHSRLVTMSSSLIGKTVTPFLREHIPSLYAPIGKDNEEISKDNDPNTKYCYRHRPDSKCRRAADETKMEVIQSELDKLPAADQQAITHVWSLFSAAPIKHRDLMLQGVITMCCFPQLSRVSHEVSEQLKIDFITFLPIEISQRILCFLDSYSLCKAAQVSRQWRQLADDDAVWVRMCSQHIDRKCTKCGFGLPLLERKRLRDYTRQRKLAKVNGRAGGYADTPSGASSLKRDATLLEAKSVQAKRPCIEGNAANPPSGPSNDKRVLQQPKLRPWKDVYRDRFQIGANWRYS